MKTYLRVRQVAERYSVSPATVWRWTKDRRLPPPVKLGPNTTGWSAEALDRLDAQRAMREVAA